MEQVAVLTGAGRATRADWERAAAAVLRKAGRMRPEDADEVAWGTLTRTTLDGIEVPPLGADDPPGHQPGHQPGQQAADQPVHAGLPGHPPYTRGSRVAPGQQAWDNRVHVGDADPAQAAADAVLDLEHGATSLWLALGRGGLTIADLPRVLQEVYLEAAPVVLDCPDDPVGAASAYASLVAERDVQPAAGTCLATDPISAGLRGAETPADLVLDLLELASRWPEGVACCAVDGTAVHDLGASDAQELGYTMAVGAALLRLLTGPAECSVPQCSVSEAAGRLEFRYAATAEQLPTVAKLRAARRLWHRVLELSGAPDAPGQVQHAVTSRAMLTRYDPWVNLLRGTVAAFAAGVGGASSVTVLPFDAALGIPDALGRRIARNTSSLLISESHVGVVSDPAGGAWAVERLTDELARAGWAEFGRIESEGGVEASLRSEVGLLGRVRGVADRRRAQVATRARAVTGVSEFPDLHERLPERRPWPAGTPAVDSSAAPFEQLRDDPAPAPVFLATLGTVAQHTARATFAANLLAAGGVDTLDAGATAGVRDVLAAYAGQPVVCLAGSDVAYAEWGAELVGALREAGAAYVVVAGRPGDRTVPAEVVDDSCAVGVDALGFLRRVRAHLVQTPGNP